MKITSKIFILLAHAFVGWMLRAAAMSIGLAVTSLQNILIIHAIGAPIFFTGISLFYFRTSTTHRPCKQH